MNLQTSLQLQIQIERQITRQLARDSLYHFTKVMWKIIEPETEFKDGWHIREICRHLEAVTEFVIPKLIINMPPRHMKSIITCVMWPAWVWIKYPERRFIFGSHSAALATRDSIKTRDVITSDLYVEIARPTWHLEEDQNSKMLFGNTKKGFRKAVGVNTSVTGDGGDYLVIDDPHNALEAHSDAANESTINWHDVAFSTRYNNPQRHAKLIVMQRLSDKDLTAHVIEKNQGYQSLCLPARYDPDAEVVTKTSLGFKDPRTKKGQLLWPEHFDEKSILDLENTLGDDASAQLDQDPKARKGGLFPRDHWKIYDKSPSDILEIVQFWDCAQKPGLTNDYSVCATWAKTQNGYYLMDLWRDKCDTPTLEAIAESLYNKWRPNAVVIEDKSAGSSLIQYLLLNTSMPVIPYDPGRRDKQVRATAATPTIKAGKCFLPKYFSWVQDFIKEHEKFPKAKHDDQVDTTSMMVEYFSARASIGPRVRSLV